MKRTIFIIISIVCLLIGCDSNSNSGGGGYNPSFTGNGNSESDAFVLRTVTAFYSNGAAASPHYEIIQRGSSQYARMEGGTNEYPINVDSNYGFNYVFWNGASWLYFY